MNTAARVQGVANADEVCITQDVMEAPGVAPLLKGLKVTEESARLKGIAELVRVHHVALA